jgi:hypothetical protein
MVGSTRFVLGIVSAAPGRTRIVGAAAARRLGELSKICDPDLCACRADCDSSDDYGKDKSRDDPRHGHPPVFCAAGISDRIDQQVNDKSLIPAPLAEN